MHDANNENKQTLEEMAEQLAKERVKQVSNKYEHEREQTVRDLQNRVEKVLQLEMELDEVKDAYRSLESNLSREDQQYKQQAQKLQKNLDQMNAMYQQVIQEKSTMKIDLSLAEKKAIRKDERIVLLEKTLVKEKETVR